MKKIYIVWKFVSIEKVTPEMVEFSMKIEGEKEGEPTLEQVELLDSRRIYLPLKEKDITSEEELNRCKEQYLKDISLFSEMITKSLGLEFEKEEEEKEESNSDSNTDTENGQHADSARACRALEQTAKKIYRSQPRQGQSSAP